MGERVEVAGLGDVETWKLSDIKPAPSNPRKIPKRAVEVVAESLREFGWQQPLVVDADGFLVAGHTRLQAAQSLGVREAPVIRASGLTPEQIRAYRIADNRTADFTTWDYPALVVELDDLAADFADVLALQDWQAIAEDFDNALDIPAEVTTDMTGNGFSVTVVFATKEQALAAEAGLMDLDGALDVRHKLRPPETKPEGYIERIKQQEVAAGNV